MQFVRGNKITFTASALKDAQGNTVTPTTAKLKLEFAAVAGGRGIALVDLADGGGGKWQYVWDSGVAKPGTVNWSTRMVGGANTIVADGIVTLTGNAANPAT